VQHICGYYVVIDEIDRSGNIRQLRKWIPGNAHAGMKWLNCRRPQVYREQQNVKNTLSMDDAFLRFLDQMDEQQKLERAQQAKVIEHMPEQRTLSMGGHEDALLMEVNEKGEFSAVPAEGITDTQGAEPHHGRNVGPHGDGAGTMTCPEV
jgi:hypothetical protein